MTQDNATLVERRGRTREMIDKLLAERQEMLVLFCQVAGLEPYTETASVTQSLQRFCQVLVDYMAFAHFEIYDRLSRGEERRGGILATAELVYPRITELTETAVDFNDKYDDNSPQADLTELGPDLSSLGEALAARVELEDRLIASMLEG